MATDPADPHRTQLARDCLRNTSYAVSEPAAPPADACLVVLLEPRLAARLDAERDAENDETLDEVAARLLSELLEALPPEPPLGQLTSTSPRRRRRKARS